MNYKKENGNAIQIVIALIVILIIGMIAVGGVLFVLIKKGDENKPQYTEFDKSLNQSNNTTSEENDKGDDNDEEDDNSISNIGPIDGNIGTIYITADDFSANLKGIKKYTIKDTIILEHNVTLHEYTGIYQKDNKLYDVLIVYTQSADGFYQGDTQIKLTFNNQVNSMDDEYILGTQVIGKGISSLKDIKQTTDPQKFITTYNGKNYKIVDTRKSGIGTIEVELASNVDLSTIVQQTNTQQQPQSQ